MNTKTKESMNLKELKQSKYLVGIYVNKLSNDNNLAACLHSIANQTLPVDLVIFTKDLSSDEIVKLKSLAEKPFVSFFEKDEAGQSVEKTITSDKKVNYVLIDATETMNFSKIFNSTFNIALENGYEGISIAEPEDGYSVKWFEIADKYSFENPNIGILAPLIRNTTNGVFSGIMNEACWLEGQSEEAGKFDINLLQRYNCLSPLGSIYKVDKVLEYSEREGEENKGRAVPMKESMKLSHYYEFFLRMIYDAVEIMTVPRIGYELKSSFKDSFEDSSCKIPQDLAVLSPEKGGLNPDEIRFWFEIAKKEFYHDEDRCKTFSETI